MCFQALIYFRCRRVCQTKRYAYAEDMTPCPEIKEKYPDDIEGHMGTCEMGINTYKRVYPGDFLCERCRAAGLQ